MTEHDSKPLYISGMKKLFNHFRIIWGTIGVQKLNNHTCRLSRSYKWNKCHGN